MADDPHNTSDISEPIATNASKEDAETTAARRELKQTSISEKSGNKKTPDSQDEISASDDEIDGDNTGGESRTKPPEIHMRDTSPDDDLKEQVSSPKKKRAHDQLDKDKDADDVATARQATAESLNGNAMVSRTDRSEPEKKRPRDKHGDESAKATGDESDPLSANVSARSSLDKPSNTKEAASTAIKPDGKDSVPQTSTSAFASSGFAKLASSTASPFGALGGSSAKTSIFGGGATPLSLFKTLGPAKPAAGPAPPKLSFGSGSTTTAASPFSGINGQPSGFGSVPGGRAGAFSSFLSGPRLTSFAKPGEAFKSDKPAKPFGAPESDAEEGIDDGEEGGDEGSAGEEASENNEDEKEKEEPKTVSDDKKKPKLQKVVVDDGEAGEVTLLQVRTKMYHMRKGVGWKERGTGMLKVNVPESSVEFDNYGNPKPESFDASVFESGGDPSDGSKGRKSVRLIMRQDHTLRVILNTVILPSMDFQLTKKLKAAHILFTAFDGKEVIQVQMKMSEANATSFTNLMKIIQKKLQDV